MVFSFEDAQLLDNDGTSIDSKMADETQLVLQDLADLFSEAEAKGDSFMDLDDILAIERTPSLAQHNDIATLLEPKTPVVIEEELERNADETKLFLLQVMDELIDAYGEEGFQGQLRILMEADKKAKRNRKSAPPILVNGRADLCCKVQQPILELYGLAGPDRGLGALSLAARPYLCDSDVQARMNTIDVLLGLHTKATFEEVCALIREQQPNLKIPKAHDTW